VRRLASRWSLTGPASPQVKGQVKVTASSLTNWQGYPAHCATSIRTFAWLEEPRRECPSQIGRCNPPRKTPRAHGTPQGPGTPVVAAVCASRNPSGSTEPTCTLSQGLAQRQRLRLRKSRASGTAGAGPVHRVRTVGFLVVMSIFEKACHRRSQIAGTLPPCNVHSQVGKCLEVQREGIPVSEAR